MRTSADFELLDLDGEFAAPEALRRFLMNPLFRAVAAQFLRAKLDPVEACTRLVARAIGQLANVPEFDEPKLPLDDLEAALVGADWPMPESPIFHAPARLLEAEMMARELCAGYRNGDCVAGLTREGLGRLHAHADRLAQQAARQEQLCGAGLLSLHPDWLPLPDVQAMPDAAAGAPEVIRLRLMRLRGLLYEHLIRGPEADAQAGWKYVTAFGCVRYCISKQHRVLHVQSQSPCGRWLNTREGWDVTAPLGGFHWVEHFLNRMPGIDHHPCHDAPDAALRQWLLRLAEREAQSSGLLDTYREAIVAKLAVPESVVEIARCIRADNAPGEADSRWCQRIWPHFDWWERMRQEAPNLMRLAWVAMEAGVLRPGDQLSVLRKHMLQLGAGQAGWAAMAREGRSHYAQALDEPCKPKAALENAAFIARNLAPFSYDEVPPQVLLESVVRLSHLVRDLSTLTLPAPLLKTAAARYRSFDLTSCKSPSGAVPLVEALRGRHDREARRSEFIDLEWLGVLAWFHEAHPVFRNREWALGWTHVMKRMQRWSLLRAAAASRPEWKSKVLAESRGALTARALTSAAALQLEGVSMAHCAADYTQACREGKSRIFSVCESANGRRVATLRLELDPKQWRVAEVRSRINRSPESPVCQLAVVVAQAYNTAEGWPVIAAARLNDQDIEDLLDNLAP